MKENTPQYEINLSGSLLSQASMKNAGQDKYSIDRVENMADPEELNPEQIMMGIESVTPEERKLIKLILSREENENEENIETDERLDLQGENPFTNEEAEQEKIEKEIKRQKEIEIKERKNRLGYRYLFGRIQPGDRQRSRKLLSRKRQQRKNLDLAA